MTEPEKIQATALPGVQTQDPGLAALLTAIFRAWGDAGVLFLILRNYQDLPSATANDVDVLVGDEQFELTERVMIESAAGCGYLLHNRVEFATVSYFFHHPGSLNQIQIDLFTQISWHCFELMRTREVLSRRVARPLFSIPNPVDEAVISLLSRLIYQGNVREKYKDQIHSGFSSDPDLATRLLSRIFGADLGSGLVKMALVRDWNAIEGLAARLRRQLIWRRATLSPCATLGAIIADFGRFIRRVRHPGGLVVVVLGADGSGKSTVAKAVVEKLKNTFNPGKMLEVHWKPVVFFKRRRRGTGAPNVNPHGRPPRGQLISLVYLIFHWIEYMIGSHLLFRKTTFKNGLVLIDRYYYDFLVDQRRFRLRTSAGLISALFRRAKEPDMVFLFDAPAEILQSRKREVAFEETARQVSAYRKVVSSIQCRTVLDATQPIHVVTARMSFCVLSHLRQRLVSRRELSQRNEQ